MLPLNMAPVGTKVRLVRSTTDEKLRRRMDDLGLINGECITLISDRLGNVVIKVKGSRLAINHELAGKLFVVPANPPASTDSNIGAAAPAANRVDRSGEFEMA